MSLASKYRPTTFSDVYGQPVTVRILTNIIKKSMFDNMLFIGPSGCGKTTCARIFANEIDAELFEVDGATHNGVAEIKEIILQSKLPSLTKQRKVIILDEAHALTSAAWSSLLITLEEQSKAIFILCTTNLDKIPATVISRLQYFNFSSVGEHDIQNKLFDIIDAEQLHVDKQAITFIAKAGNGNVRQSIAMLDKCLLYTKRVTLEDAQKVLNIVDSRTIHFIFDLMIDDKQRAIRHIQQLYEDGFNLYQFMLTALDVMLEKEEVNHVAFILNVLEDLRFMLANPSNVCQFVCAKVLVR